MATIIAAGLQLQTQAEEAAEQLVLAGFAPEKVTSFFINPPGQHALYPIGGDRYESPGTTEKIDKNTKAGATFVGMTEAVIGVMHENAHAHDAPHMGKPETPLHRAGMLVAVEVTDQAEKDKAVALLTQLDAHHVAEEVGEIVNGEWIDFDPLSEPNYL
jgi:hypothetical protein